MKKFSFRLLSVLFLGGTLFLTSCSDDEDEAVGPSLQFFATGVNGDVTLEPGEVFTVSWDAQAGDANLQTFSVTKNGVDANGANNSYPVELSGSDRDRYTADDDFTADPNEGVYAYVFTVRDRDGLSASRTINVTVEESSTTTPLSDAQDFTWQRVGGSAGTGLAQFGLAWTSNTSTSAVIKKDADKLVILSTADWTNITTKEDLMAAIDGGTDTDEYTGVT